MAENPKASLRRTLLRARAGLTPEQLEVEAATLAEHLLALEEVRRAGTVAAYVSVGREPGTRPLLARLREQGTRVLLPVLEPDGDLEWTAYAGELRAADRGLLEPTGERLGREAIATADVVVVPGLAVDRTGLRMGRGGGSYDRALARVTPEALTCVLLHEGEVLEHVPAEPHDRRVDAAVTAAGVTRF